MPDVCGVHGVIEGLCVCVCLQGGGLMDDQLNYQ